MLKQRNWGSDMVLRHFLLWFQKFFTPLINVTYDLLKFVASSMPFHSAKSLTTYCKKQRDIRKGSTSFYYHKAR